MNLEQLNARFEPAYRANPAAVKSIMKETARLIGVAIDRQIGVFSHDTLFNEVRPAMPSGADIGINADLADGILRMLIQETVNQRCQFLPDSEQELAMLNRITGVMKEHGFKTAGEAIEFLRKQQLN